MSSGVTNLDKGHKAMVKDAERYRWLRDRAGNSILKDLGAESRPTEWDKIVDADIASSASEEVR